jgi:FkbM family methyltransferase
VLLVMLAAKLVNFYRWWYGHLNLKGAGFLLSKLAHVIPDLQAFPLTIPGLAVLKVDFRDASAFVWQNYLLGKKTQEHGLLLAMARYCKPDYVLWDIGANIGMISAYFADPAYNMKAIHAFEPNPSMFSALQSLFCSSKNCHIHKIALSSDNAPKQLHVPYGVSCMGSLSKELAGKNAVAYTVDCRTADELVASCQAPPPTIVKIDVEGHEANVLKGMQKTLAEYKPVVFLEHIFMDEQELLYFKNYTLMTISDSDGTLHPGFSPELGHNIALIPK